MRVRPRAADWRSQGVTSQNPTSTVKHTLHTTCACTCARPSFRAMRAATDIPPAGRAGRRLNAKDSLMVHWDRPTVSATSRHHKLQLPLLLEMVQNHSHNQLSQHMCNLLPG